MSSRQGKKRKKWKAAKQAAAKMTTARASVTKQTNTPQPIVPKQIEPQIRWPQRLPRAVGLAWKGACVFLVLFGGLAAAYSLRPQINVFAISSFNKDAPFEPILTITNVGYLELYDATFACYFLETMRADRNIAGTRLIAKNDQNQDAGNNIQDEPILRPQEPVAKTCAMSSKLEGTHVENVIITLRIDFRPSFWQWRVSKFARFRSRVNASGEIQWIPDPKDDPYNHN